MTVTKLSERRDEMTIALMSTAIILGHCGQIYLNTFLNAFITVISGFLKDRQRQ
jgi:hypothetical protein